MKKGQLSIDLLIALLIGSIFFTALIAHSESIKENTEENTKIGAMKSILRETYSAIAITKSQGTEVTIRTKTIEDCRIGINMNEINVLSGTDEVSYSGFLIQGININRNPLQQPISLNCGDEMKITVI